MSTATLEAPLHDPASPGRSSAYCGHCRDERAAGLDAYRSWRTRHTFPRHTDQPVPAPAEARGVVRRVRFDDLPEDAWPRLWAWWVHADGVPTRGGYAPTWPAAMELAEASVLVDRVGLAGLVTA